MRQIEQFEKAIHRITIGEASELRIANLEPLVAELGRQPFHLRTIRRRLLRNHDVHLRRIAENTRETPLHAVGSSKDGTSEIGLRFPISRGRRQFRIGLIQPRGEANAAGDAVEFDQCQAGLGEEQVRTNDARHGVLESRIALQCDQRGRFALIEPGRHPGWLLAADALAIEQIDGAIKLVQDASESIQLPGESWIQGEGFGRNPPMVSGK